MLKCLYSALVKLLLSRCIFSPSFVILSQQDWAGWRLVELSSSTSEWQQTQDSSYKKDLLPCVPKIKWEKMNGRKEICKHIDKQYKTGGKMTMLLSIKWCTTTIHSPFDHSFLTSCAFQKEMIWNGTRRGVHMQIVHRLCCWFNSLCIWCKLQGSRKWI